MIIIIIHVYILVVTVLVTQFKRLVGSSGGGNDYAIWHIQLFTRECDSTDVKGKCKCNLFTHGALRSSQELIQKCPCIPGSNWNLEMLVFKLYMAQNVFLLIWKAFQNTEECRFSFERSFFVLEILTLFYYANQ